MSLIIFADELKPLPSEKLGNHNETNRILKKLISILPNLRHKVDSAINQNKRYWSVLLNDVQLPVSKINEVDLNLIETLIRQELDLPDYYQVKLDWVPLLDSIQNIYMDKYDLWVRKQQRFLRITIQFS